MGSVSGGHLDVLFFAVLPYVAIVLFLVVTVQRYRKQSFFLLQPQLAVPREPPALLGHGAVPLRHPVRAASGTWSRSCCRARSFGGTAFRRGLYILEVTALIGGLLTLIGFVALVVRRFTNTRLRKVLPRPADWVVYVLLVTQVLTGIAVAVTARVGLELVRVDADPVSLVARRAEPRHQLRRADAAHGQGAHHQRVPADRLLPLHPAGPTSWSFPTCTCGGPTQVVRWNRARGRQS